MPFAPSGLARRSSSSTNSTSMSEGMSALTGIALFERFLASHRPSLASWRVCSMAAMPQPQMIPPVICARAVRGLMMRPALYAPTARRKRSSPSSGIDADLDEDRDGVGTIEMATCPVCGQALADPKAAARVHANLKKLRDVERKTLRHREGPRRATRGRGRLAHGRDNPRSAVTRRPRHLARSVRSPCSGRALGRRTR